MPKTTKPKNTTRQPKCLYSAHPWKCRYHKDRSEILAYVEASGAWETVADIRPTAGASAETMALFICDIINDNQKSKTLLQEAMEALELCLEEEGLTFSSEQAADSVVTRIKKSVG
jgi:hypothetical protein